MVSNIHEVVRTASEGDHGKGGKCDCGVGGGGSRF